MPTDLSYLKTAADCDEALAYAQQLKGDLEYALQGETRDSARQGRLTKTVSEDLADVNDELAYVTTRYNALPDGPKKIKLRVEKERLENRQAGLEKRGLTNSLAAQIDAQVDYLRMEAELGAVNRFITDVDAHKRSV